MPPTLPTARLVLTPVAHHDLPALHAHWNDPQVARWLWDGNPVDPQTVAHLIENSIQTFQRAGWGLWAMRPAADAPLIGICGLCRFEPVPGVELLYSLDPAHWSSGLATEAATAVLAHAFDTLGLTELFATTDDANAASIRLLHRLGAVPTTPIQVDDHTYPCFVIRPGNPGMLARGPCSSMDRATDF
jgi:[ribosomal protein S5]-alanine N-acetyltransferase